MSKSTTNRKMVTVAMLVAILLVAIDVTVVSTAMPQIVSDLSGLKLISWVFAIYTLTTSVTTPIYGKLADLFGRKKVFIFGVILFVVGSMLSGAAQTMNQLIWFRAFQGIGAGAVMPLTFTIIGDLFPGEQRAKMQGVFSSVWGIAGLLGPLVGGFFVDQISWRWIFYINLPIGLVSLVLITVFFHETVELKKDRKIDYLGAITFTIGISTLLYALLNAGPGQKYAWNSTILGHSATSSGLTLMPMSIAWPLGATFAGRYMYKIGSKFTAILGAVLIALGGTWLLAVELDSPYWYFVGIMIVIGLGMGYATTPTTVLVQSAVGWQMRGAATASNSFTKSIGQTVGVAIFGTIFNNSLITFGKEHAGGSWSGGDNISNLLSSDTLHQLPANVMTMIQEALAHGMHLVFILVFFIGIANLLCTLFLPSHKKVMEHQKQVQH
ncbi:MDR family MFS transporter [Bacillus sp. AFS073361]|uniref:MDR family MFS transporter n=1 Tax=Bacillus sp. AFS073361 TaxID=2033511 RepID=UPI00211DA0DA|nr:MDR family MFS transporter [Bacillus sp. AFS073361]